MSTDLSANISGIFSQYAANPASFVDFTGFLEHLGQAYKDNTARGRASDMALEKALAAAAEGDPQLAARLSERGGDVVTISEAAHKLVDQYKNAATPTGTSMPSANMQATTAQGTEVTVNATSHKQGGFSFGGAEGNSLGLAKQGSTFTLGGQHGEDPVEVSYSVTFRQYGGQEQTFELTGNTIFKEATDGTIMQVSAEQGGSLTGTDGQDIMINITDNAMVDGGGGDDIVFNLGTGATVRGGAGNDILLSMGDNAQVDGGEGDDAIAILQDTLRAPFDKQEADSVKESDDKSTYSRPRFSQTVNVDAGSGDDVVVLAPTMYKSRISGGDGMDSIFANDLLHSTLDAGDGSDSVIMGTATKSTIGLGAGSDMLQAAGLIKSTLMGGDGNDSISVKDAYMSVINAGAGDDVVMVEEGEKNSIIGASGDDYLYVSEGADLIAGNDGNDFIRADVLPGSALGDSGDDTMIIGGTGGRVDGGAGNDRLWIGSASGATIEGGAGDDEIRVDKAFKSTIDGGEGNDSIHVGDVNKSIINGGAGDDNLWIASAIESTVTGGAGTNKVLMGYAALARNTASMDISV